MALPMNLNNYPKRLFGIQIPESVFTPLTSSQSAVLDILRYFAAFLVLLTHLLTHFYDQAYYPYRQFYYTNLGSIGVGIFFVLSGFLIAYTVIRKQDSSKSYSFQIYFVERFSRIYVVLVPAMLLAVIFNMLNNHFIHGASEHRFTMYHFFTTALMLQGVRGITGHIETFELIEPSWSLNYEFFFYIIYGAIILHFSMGSSFKNWLVRGSIVCLVVFLALRLDSIYHYVYNWMLGVLIAWLYVKGFRFRLNSLRKGFLILLILGYGSLLYFARDYVGSWVSVTFIGLLIYGLLMLFEEKSLPNSIKIYAKFFSSYSYSMYLIHYGIIHLVYLKYIELGILSQSRDSLSLRFATVILLVVLINVASYLFSLIAENRTHQLREFILRFVQR